MNKSYLGDGVYVEIDPGGRLVLTTEDATVRPGCDPVTSVIVLEPHVYNALTNYVERAWEPDL